MLGIGLEIPKGDACCINGPGDESNGTDLYDKRGYCESKSVLLRGKCLLVVSLPSVCLKCLLTSEADPQGSQGFSGTQLRLPFVGGCAVTMGVACFVVVGLQLDSPWRFVIRNSYLSLGSSSGVNNLESLVRLAKPWMVGLSFCWRLSDMDDYSLTVRLQRKSKLCRLAPLESQQTSASDVKMLNESSPKFRPSKNLQECWRQKYHSTSCTYQ